jgi:hypothetical protein
MRRLASVPLHGGATAVAAALAVAALIFVFVQSAWRGGAPDETAELFHAERSAT